MEEASSEVFEVHLPIPDIEAHRAIAVATEAREKHSSGGSKAGGWPQVILPPVWKGRRREAGGDGKLGQSLKQQST